MANDQTSRQVPDPERDSGEGTSARGRPLNTLQEVRREMTRVYWEARRNRMQMDRAKGLVYMLGQLSALVKEGELMDRIAEVERVLKGGNR